MGQYNDLLNPCSLMVYMGAIANGGKAAVPQLIYRTVTPLGIPASFYLPHKTGTLISSTTAETLSGMMARNVSEVYGSGRFPNMDICAKSGTAEVGGGKTPTSWFSGFLRNEDAPYAFAVVVEEGGKRFQNRRRRRLQRAECPGKWGLSSLFELKAPHLLILSKR